ncbi:acyl-CoA thioesterase II [Luteococcus sediminum]
MPQNTEELVQLLQLEEIEHDLYRGQQPVTDWQRTFGGQVLAQALVAAGRTVDPSRMCHSLHAYFLKGGRPDKPIIYDVEKIRDGGSLSVRRVVARQNGENIFALNASFHIDEPGLDHSDPMPANVPAPEDCPTMRDVMSRMVGDVPMLNEWEALEVRFAGDSGMSNAIEAKSHSAHLRVWVRTTSALPADPLLHQAVLAYLSDMTLLSVSVVPHKVVFGGPKMQIASIDHSMWFHRPVRADEWMLYDQVSPSASKALGFSTGRILQGGKLVATCSQEGLIRVVE